MPESLITPKKIVKDIFVECRRYIRYNLSNILMHDNIGGVPMKKAFSIFLIIVSLLSLSGCEDSATVDTPSPSSQSQSSPSPRPTRTPSQFQASNTSDLLGQWEQFDSEYSGLHQVAIISGETIEIYWINEEMSTQYLYWSGSFPEAEPIESSYSWVSKNNLERAVLSPVASWDETKEFTYVDGQINYSTTSVGITTTMYLEKNTWNPDLDEDVFFENGTFPFSAGGIEFSVPDCFTEDGDQSSAWTYFDFYHGGSISGYLGIVEYSTTQQEFDQEKWELVEYYVGEDAEKLGSRDATVAGFKGIAFLYHISPNNVPQNVYGALVYNPQEEKGILCVFTLAREEDYQEFFNQLMENAIQKWCVRDVKWDIAFKHTSTAGSSVYLVDLDGGIAIHYTKKGSKIGSISFGEVSGSLDDMLDIALEMANGEKWHYYFTWKYPDKPNDRFISEFNAKGEEQYETYSEVSVSSAVSDVKNYIITP